MTDKKIPTIPLRNFPVHISRSVLPTTEYHNHECYEFVYVYEGMVDHILNGEHYLLSAGNYFLLSPSDKHMYVAVNREPFRIINFTFDPAMIDQSFTLETPFNEMIKHPSIGLSHKNLTASPLGVQFSDETKNLMPMFLSSFTEYQQKKPGYLNVLRATLIRGIIACLRNVYADENTFDKSSFVDNIIRYVNDNCSENISLSALCDSLGYTVPYVSRVFKEQIGMNFSEYLVKVRVQKACSLLLSTDMTVQQVVNAVGYSNTDFFHRA